MNFMLFLLFSFLLILLAFQQTHPLNFSLNLLLVSSLVSAYIMRILSTWIGLSLILIFMGGMMIIILYVSALASENKFNLIASLPWVLMFLAPVLPFTLNMSLSHFSNYPIYALYLDCSSYSLFLLLFYLLLTLIVVVSVSESYHGPVSMWN